MTVKQISILAIVLFISINSYSQSQEEKWYKMLDDSLIKYPKNSDVLFFRGSRFMENKNFDKASIDFSSALKYLHEFKLYSKPSNIINGKALDSSTILHNRAACYDRLNSIDNSIADYEYLKKAKPNDFFYQIAVSNLYIKHKLFKKAQIEINELKKNNTERGLVQQALLYYETEKYKKALMTIESVLQKYPISIEGIILKGKVLAKLKRQEESCKYFDEASSKMTLEYFGGQRGYKSDFEKEIKSLKLLYCK
jgi:tetratricopeptide (TPR) repeat protein